VNHPTKDSGSSEYADPEKTSCGTRARHSFLSLFDLLDTSYCNLDGRTISPLEQQF